jgi:TatA/E family protein of Tat protein translocase
LFGIGGWEFVVIVVLALLLFGPDKLPQFARTLGRFMRDFKRYQDLMEATIRAEMFEADPSLRKDAFDTAKEFRKKVGGGGFEKQEAPAEDEAVPEESPAAGEQPESAAAPADEEISAQPCEVADAEITEAGEGEQGEA